MPSLREYMTHLGSRLLGDLGPGAPSWTVIDVDWDPVGAAPPEEVVGMTFELETLYDADNTELLVLRDTTASLIVSYRSGSRSAPFQVAVPISAPANRALAEFASQLQDHVLESADTRGLPLPACPVHGTHPLSPREDVDHASWWCPATETRIRRIVDR